MLNFILTFFAILLFVTDCSAERYATPVYGEAISIGVPIVPSSVKVLCNGTAVNDTLFTTTADGKVILLAQVECDSVDVIYTPLSEFLPARSRHRLLWGTRTIAQSGQSVQTADNSPTMSFRTNGSLLRGIRITNTGDVSSTSSLHFEAEGDLAGDVHITALLSDESSPIQPEGRSLELSELDKVLIEAESPHLSASFGDIDLSLAGGSFLQLDRRIQGIQGKVNYDVFSMSAFGSLLRGQFNSIEFSASEGNQGPYPLWGAQSERDIVIVAGTEKVWLNGEILRRGEDADYIMDYNLAQITFTNNRSLNNSDRIVVDFQYLSDNYARSFFGGAVSAKLSEKIAFQLGATSQKDDEQNPIAALSDTAMQILQECGDSIPDTLSAPKSLQIANAAMSISAQKYALTAEYAFSSNDENLYSSLDDGDNLGDAATVSGTLTVAQPVKLFAAGRYISASFETPGRIDPAEFNREWNISTTSDGSEDVILQCGSSITLAYGSISFWLGQRKLGAEKSQRANTFAQIYLDNWNAKLAINDAKSSQSERTTGTLSLIRKQNYGLSLMENIVSAERYLGQEADTIYIGIVHGDEILLSGLRFGVNGAISGYMVRRNAGWNDFSRTMEFGGSITGKFGKLSYTRHIFTAKDTAAGESQKSDLISLRTNVVIGKTSAAATYQVSKSQSELLNKIYTYVGEGEGSYVWDEELEEYVPDVNGDYVLEYQPTGEFRPVIRSDGSFSLSAQMNFIPYGASAAIDISFRSENQRDGWRSYYLSPSRMFYDDSLTSGTVSATARINFLRKSPLGIQWMSTYRKSAYRNYSSGAELSANRSHTLSIVGPLPLAITADVDFGYETDDAMRQTLDHWVDARQLSLSLALSRRFGRWLRTTASSKIADITDQGTTPQTDANLWTISIDATATFGKITIRSHAQRAMLSSESSYLPYELSAGWDVGENFEWNSSISYRAGAKTELSLIYRGERKASANTKHTAEARVRLLF